MLVQSPSYRHPGEGRDPAALTGANLSPAFAGVASS